MWEPDWDKMSEARREITATVLDFADIIKRSDLAVLDIGIGGDPPPSQNYYLLKGTYKSFQTMDINARFNPDIVHDITKRTDFEDDHFDLVMCCETLEHIYDIGAALDEVCRIGRAVVVSIPFEYRYHDSPHDYWRVSKDALSKMLEDRGMYYVEADWLCGKKHSFAIATKGDFSEICL